MEIHSNPPISDSLKKNEPSRNAGTNHSSLNALANLVSEQWNQVRSRPETPPAQL